MSHQSHQSQQQTTPGSELDLDLHDSGSSDAILAAALGLSLELGSSSPTQRAPPAATTAGASTVRSMQLQARAVYRTGGPDPAVSVPMDVDISHADVSMASIDDDRNDDMMTDTAPAASASAVGMPRPPLPGKRKRRPSSLPSVDSLLVLIPSPSSNHEQHARTPPPTSAHHPAAAHTAVPVALAAEPDLMHTRSGPASPLLLTPLDPLASLFSTTQASVSPQPSPTLPPHFRRARGGSSAPRPTSLLAKLDHLPIELLHLIAEYVFSTPAHVSDPMLATRPHTQLAHLARACKRVYSAVAPVLYEVPAVESVTQLRRLSVSLHVCALRTFVSAHVAMASTKCRVHAFGAGVPVFAYVRGLDISRLEDGARGKREVAALVSRVVKIARARTCDEVKQSVGMGGWEAVDATLGDEQCVCISSWALALDGREVAGSVSAAAPSPSLLRRTASNGDLHWSSKSDLPPLGVYGMDLSSSTSPSISSTPPSPTISLSTSSDYLPPPRLTHLNLSFIKSLTPSLLTSLLLSPHSAPLRLTRLNLAGTHLPDALLASLLGLSAPTLMRLSLAWNPHLTDLTLASLAAGAGTPASAVASLKLTHLDLTHCRDLSDWSLAKLAPVLPALRALGIAWCPRISGRVVHAALSYWPHLRALSVAGCPRVGGREAVARMWDGYVVADVELRRRVGRVSELVGAEGVGAGAGGRGAVVGVVERVPRLMIDEPGMGGCVYYLDV